ncbi:anthranilate synthase component I [Lacisediminihabitans changchengi]|uniref:Anthranilate synthase component 1 n=1 Tax=Lacisediminihabitans changchengi TaxID=2787634 RepID=A0A934SMH8_9MICO|nr:anthranilate synthase component I [Lacisediminihabitans changchengi]MBK4346808.1 anthranilate synthase component I [Lacisediminihabitans changchengi]MBK4348069.1 anthranilate synthase component I [Lacisediminihabitans changchengi]
MSETSTREEFDSLLAGHRVVPVIRELFADGETPVGIFRKLAKGTPGTFLLESAEQGGIWSRYSFVGASSFGVLTQVDGEAVWLDYGIDEARALGTDFSRAPLEALGHLYERWGTAHVPGHPPLTGGLVGFIGWEAIRQIESLPNIPPADFAIPGQAFSFVSELVVLDHRTGAVLLIATALNDGVDDAAQLWAGAQSRLDDMQRRLAEPSEAWLAEVDLTVAPSPTPRILPAEYQAAVERSKDFIRDGDVFQVVISQRFDHEATADPIDVYRVLRTLNPSPYMYLLSLEDAAGEPYWIVGSSPEALVKVENDHVYMHPIAGSRPRGQNPEEDLALSDELLGDPKERAEHLMLVDLARNDLSKVCVAGSVEVTEFMRVERFSHIMHLVSSVEGDLRPDANSIDVFRATFPAGTLSGAPKPRALEIIDELEVAQRGLYGGVVGYFGFAGDLDLAIAIRTTTIARGVARVQAGAGLVADSDPLSEHQETQNKAAAPLRAVAVANAMKRVGS